MSTAGREAIRFVVDAESGQRSRADTVILELQHGEQHQQFELPKGRWSDRRHRLE